MFSTNDSIKVKIGDNHYKECKAVLDSRNAILSIELFRERQPSGNYFAIEADNITQMCFDLSSSYEIKSIEVIGAKFEMIENLVLPTCSTHGNLVFDQNQNYQTQGTWTRHDEYEEYDECESKEYRFDQPVEMTASTDSMLLRVCIGRLPITQIIAASANLFYGLSEDALQEIWINNPLLG